MPRPQRIAPDDQVLTAGFAEIRRRAGVAEEFPVEVLDAVRARGSDPAPATREERADRRGVELLSIDPAGSRDLDQALHLERRGSGYRFTYAIADVGAFVTPGGPVDVEARRRGTTIYCPDRRIPLHPTELSEGRASLLAGEDRPAVVWTIDLDQRGDTADVRVERGLVRNRRALDYVGVQHAIDSGTADPVLQLLAEVGELRLEREVERGGVSLNLPTQEVVAVGDHYELRFERKVRAEDWNAELSLCCGMAAAAVMLDAGFGLLRTLPAPGAASLAELRLSSAALGVPWDEETPYAQWVRSIDVATPSGVALMERAARTLRGAGYLAFESAPTTDTTHAAVNAPYAHVTAPLRRLADRFANECVLAAAAGRRAPGWVTDALETLPAVMAETGRTANGVDHACVELTEAVTLRHRVGDLFDAMVISGATPGGSERGDAAHPDASRRRASRVQVVDPAVVGPFDGPAPPEGTWIRARLIEADVDGPVVRFGP